MQSGAFERYWQLFEGRNDQYAVGGPKPDQPWKYRYSKREAPLTPELIQSHLDGDTTIGVYCERDGVARWFACDFDSPKDQDENPVEGGFEIALGEALTAKAALLREGLITYIERSRSGNGVHLWGFVDNWVDARELARAVFTRVPALKTLDRGKLYPPLRASANSILICLPYAGEAVERGGSMFLDVVRQADGSGFHIDEIPLEKFIEQVKVNPASVITELAENPKEGTTPANRPDGSVAAGTPSAGGALLGDFLGRPAKPGTGILKMLSPFGCGFMRSVWLNQHDPRLVGEPEWYAFLGQLTAFKHGREAAHSIFKDHKHYNPDGMNAKYDHALQNPPMGCSLIHERFGDKHKCNGCPMKAPWHRGIQPDGKSVPISQLCGESPEELERLELANDLERIKRLDASEEPEGIALGLPAVDQHFRLAPGEFAAFGAQPSIGKTALAVHVACSVAGRGTEVALFSAESGPASIHDRMLAWRSGVDSYAFKGMRNHGGQKLRLSREEWSKVEEASDWLKRQPIWENYTTTTPERIYDAFEAMMCKRGKPFTYPALSIFDYFQYAQGNDEFKPGEEHVRLARASFAFKSITKIVEHPFFLLAQLIRESEGSDDPQLNWWRGTARLEHDIDSGLIMTGVRMPGLYAPRVIHCLKKREGKVGWKEEILLEQAISRFRGKPSESVKEGEVIDEPWFGTGGQGEFIKSAND